MICITIAQESRRMAMADMHNAAEQCDLVEIRLDRFGKAPDIPELFAHKPKPIIFSCRRQTEGGDWSGSEEERLAQLRLCIVHKADYVEIELDAADQIRPFPPAKRVITYTNLQETPANIAEIYAQAQTKKPDVIKLTTLARTPEEAWPVLKILANPPVPTVAVGLGKPGILLSLLGKKIGSPWTYAALEKGMEVYPGQPTVRELREIYHYDQINNSTPLIGVTGFGKREYVMTGVMNHSLAHSGLAARCLPLGVGSVTLFRKIMDAVHLRALAVDEAHHEPIMKIVAQSDPLAQQAQAADLLLPTKEKEWQGYYTLGPAALAALEQTLAPKSSGAPLQGRMILIVGANAVARTIAHGIKQRGGVIIIASHERQKALQLAQALECRHIQFEALYTTMHDVLIVCDREKNHTRPPRGSAEAGIHPGYLRPGMAVMDLTAKVERSNLLNDAVTRGCTIVEPWFVLREQLIAQLQLITGKEVPRQVVQEKLNSLLEEVASSQ
jgi:3-dehydroquinate dehydratase / shikimate dehydrogenase